MATRLTPSGVKPRSDANWVAQSLAGTPSQNLILPRPAPTGPNNNLAGSRLSSSTTAVPRALSGRSQQYLSIATLLGGLAGAVKPEGIGARLGQVGAARAKQIRFENAFARMLAGADMAPGDFEGLGPEDIGQITALVGQRNQMELDKQKAEMERERLRIERVKAGLEIGQVGVAMSASEEAAQKFWTGIASEYGLPASMEIMTPMMQRAKERDAQFEQLKGMEEIKRKNRLQEIGAMSAASINETRTKLGMENDAKMDMAFRMAKATGTTVKQQEVLARFSDLIRGFSGQEFPDVEARYEALDRAWVTAGGDKGTWKAPGPPGAGGDFVGDLISGTPGVKMPEGVSPGTTVFGESDLGVELFR